MSQKYKALVIFAMIFILIDQLSKYCAVFYLSHKVIYNTGIFFGSVDDSILLILFLLLGVFILGYLFIKSPKIYYLPLTLIASGAISNIIDRFMYHGVVDYINLGLWSDFNLADIYIVFGAIWFLLIMFTHKKQTTA